MIISLAQLVAESLTPFQYFIVDDVSDHLMGPPIPGYELTMLEHSWKRGSWITCCCITRVNLAYVGEDSATPHHANPIMAADPEFSEKLNKELNKLHRMYCYPNRLVGDDDVNGETHW